MHLRLAGIIFLFRDDFTTTEAAPLTSPRTSEPGPGIFTNHADAGAAEISGGKLTITTPTTYGAYGSAQTRVTGLCVAINFTVVDGIRNWRIGWWQSTTIDSAGGTRAHQLGSHSDVNVDVFEEVGNFDEVGIHATATPANYFIILRTTGAFYVIGDTLVMVSTIPNNTPVYPAIYKDELGAEIDFLRVSQLPVPWDTDNGIATEILAGARDAGETFVHEADCLIEFEVVAVPSAGQIEVKFRIQDASNYWMVTIDSDGDLDLDEVVDGTPTQRDTAATVVNDSDRIIIVVDNETIMVYEVSTLRLDYSSAANFKTETDGELEDEGSDGSVSDIISWPRTLSGDAKSALDDVIA